MRLDGEAGQIGDDLGARKSRGAFFTPPPICRFLAEWAIRDPGDSVLEPSCGEAAFLQAAGEHVRSLRRVGASGGNGELCGHEIHGSSATRARDLLRSKGHDACIEVGDFFLNDPSPRFDAVIGNPPYVRYQDFTGASRARARAAALRAGVPLSGLASSWAAFTVHAAQFLKPSGRLGLVLPAELLTVNYAAEVRAYLMRRFASVRLVLFDERVFPGVLEEVVLLMAEGDGPTDHCQLYQVESIADLRSLGPSRRWQPKVPRETWMPSLITESAHEILSALESSGAFTTLRNWGETTLGMVTGNNDYFALSPERVQQALIPDRDLLRLSPPGSRHLRGLRFTQADWESLGRQGKSTLLFRPTSRRRLSKASSRYVEQGESSEVDLAYKCRVRSPWWEVPLVRPAHLLLTYMNADAPRICANVAGVHHLNSVHGVYLKPGLITLGRTLLPIASLNSATLLGAEIVGRAYGGGMLKLEPREADVLPIPAVALAASLRDKLTAIRPSVEQLLRANQLADASVMVDHVLFDGVPTIGRKAIDELRDARRGMSDRRRTRGKARI